MIIWLNGAFGAGKTQTAYELSRRLPNSYVYDPENAGFFIRDNLPPSLRGDDFQDYPMWRAFNFAMLDDIASRFDGHVIVPMTITNRQYYDELPGALSRKYDVRHFILYAQKETSCGVWRRGWKAAILGGRSKSTGASRPSTRILRRKRFTPTIGASPKRPGRSLT